MTARARNLKPFPKGKSGNPSGRPRVKSVQLEKLFADVVDDHWPAILKALVAKAKRGDVRAIETLLDRRFGKVRQDMTIETENPLLALIAMDEESRLKYLHKLRQKAHD